MATHVTHTPGSCAVEVEKTAQKEFGLRTRKPQEQPTFHALQRDVSRGQHVETTVEMKRKRSGGSSWAQRLSGFSLFYCLLSALLLLPSASDAIESSWILKLDAPDDLNRQAVQGEPFLVQPRLTLRNPTNPVYNQPGIRVEAHCVTSGCVVDCAKKIRLPGNCSALTDALGQVQFTDLVLIDESLGTYFLDFTIGDTAPSQNEVSGFSMDLALGLSTLPPQKGLDSAFMRPSRRVVIAGITTAQTDAVSVALKDAQSLLLELSQLPVFAVLVPVDPASNPGAEVIATMRPACLSKEEICIEDPGFEGCATGNPLADPCDDARFPDDHKKSPFPVTCCEMEMANCLQMQVPFGTPCCDCSRPKCSLCQVPKDGVVSYTFDFRRTGKFNIKFLSQTLHGGLHESLDASAIITVLANDVLTTLGLRVQPGNLYIGTSTGDELAVMTPQPEIYFADKFGNAGRLQGLAAGSNDAVIALLCYDGSASLDEGDVPAGLCLCDHVADCFPTIDAKQHLRNILIDGVEVPTSFISGNVTPPVATSNGLSGVHFTELYTYVARSDLRIFFKHVQFGAFAAMNVTSDRFAISAGRLQTLRVMTNLSEVRGCDRCPEGIYLAGDVVHVSVRLYDIFDNVLAFCNPSSQFCLQHEHEKMEVQVLLDGDIFSGSALNTRLTSDSLTEVVAGNGKAVFEDIRFATAATGYSLRFRTPGKMFLPVDDITVDRVIQVESSVFTVSAGRPISIAPSRAALIAADSELFALQPHIELLDAYGNRVENHCYTDCGGLLTGKCLLDVTNCGAHTQITVQIRTDDISNDPLFDGTKTVSAQNGLAMFTDLSIDLFGDGSTHGSSDACVCESGLCPSCPVCYNAQHPLETVQLMFSTSIDGVELKTEQPVEIKRRVQELTTLNQPNENDVTVTSREYFVMPLTVEALSCDRKRVTDAVAYSTVSIKDGPAQSELFGKKTEPLINGLFTFTSLYLDTPGAYTLQFTYDGNAQVATKDSATFVVGKQVDNLQLLVTPEMTTSIAGTPFEIQPQATLVDEDGLICVGASKSITASIYQDPGNAIAHMPGSTKLFGRVVMKAILGKVRFEDLMIRKASVGQDINTGGYTLRFSLDTFYSTTKEFFVAPGDWAGLHVPMYAQPLSSQAGQPFPRQPQVLLVDRFLNIILPSQVPRGTFVNVTIVENVEYQALNPATILRHGCDEVCSPKPLPIICRTCPDLSMIASAARVAYTDLRIDIIYPAYHLNFNASNGDDGSFSVQSNPFSVTPADGAGLILSNFERTFVADQVVTQPAVTLSDRYGNVVNDVSKLIDGILHVRLITLGDQLPVAPPAMPVVGQKPGSVCTVYSEPLGGNLQADISTGRAKFSDLSVRQAMTQYRLEFEVATTIGALIRKSQFFDVNPGVPVRLCNMSLPNRCSQHSACLDHAEIVCVDLFGNVQKDCVVCKGTMPVDGECLDGANPLLSDQWNDDCPLGKICAVLLSPAVANVVAEDMCNGKPCASVIPPSGPFGALFDSLKFSFPSADYVIRFYTYLAHPTLVMSKILFEYTTPMLEVVPPRPQILTATFSSSFVQLHLDFDRITDNSPKSFGQKESCDNYLDPIFIATLGTPVSCGWLNSRLLVIHLGVDATVDPHTQVLLAQNNTITHTATYNGYVMTSLPATTDVGVFVGGIALIAVNPRFPPNTPSPRPVIVGAQNIGACELLWVDARSSTGNAGRSFSDIEWGVNFDHSYLMDGILSAKGKPLFINRFIDFSSLLPGEVNHVTLRLRPNADVIQGSIITIHGLPGPSRKAAGCVSADDALAAPPQYVNCISKFETTKHMNSEQQGSTYTASRCIDVPITGLGQRYFELNGATAGTGVPVAQWYDGPGGVELHLRVLGMRADASSNPCPAELCGECNCAAFIPAGEVTKIQFDFVNPHMATQPARLAIESNCDQFYYACNPTFNTGTGGPQGPINWLKEENEMQVNCGPLWNEGQACEGPVIFGKSNYDIELVSGSISESTIVKGALNTLTVTIVPSTRMPAGSRILIRNLVGSTTGSGTLCLRNVRNLGTMHEEHIFNCKECSSGVEFADWTATSGSLALTIKNGSSVTDAGISFSFDLYNSDNINRLTEECTERDYKKCPSNAQPEIRLLSPARYTGDWVPLEVPLHGVLGSGLNPTFVTAYVTEGNSIQGHTNLLLFQFSANTDLAGGSVVTLFTDSPGGMGRSISSSVPLFYANDMLGCWSLTWQGPNLNGESTENAAGQVIREVHLALAAGCHIPATQTIELAIKVSNPQHHAASPSISIRSSYTGCVQCVENCGCGKSDTVDVEIPSFPVQGSILQSNSVTNFTTALAREDMTVQGQLNRIIVEFQSKFDATAPSGSNSMFTLSGLSGLISPSGDIAIDFNAGSELPTSRMANFDATAGTLTFDLPAYIPSFTPISFSFTLENGRTQQPPPAIFLTASTSAALCGDSVRAFCKIVELDTEASSDSVVYVPRVVASGSILGFTGRPRITTKTIKELTRVGKAFNIITVHVRTNFYIRSPASITLSELRGTSWPPECRNNELNIRPSFMKLLPNCSCTNCDAYLACGCSDTVLLQNKENLFMWQAEGSNLFGSPKEKLTVSDVLGKWDPLEGQLSLDFAPGREFEVGEDIVFSFAVQNPDLAKYTPRTINVTVASPDIRIETSMDGTVLGSGSAPGFTVFEVQEASNVAGEFNENFVKLEANFPMLSLHSNTNPGLLLLGEMKGYGTPGGFMPIFGEEAFSVSKTAYANWSVTHPFKPSSLELKAGVMMGGCQSVGGVENCALKVPGVFDYSSLGTNSFSFIVQNTLLLNAGDSNPSIQYVSKEVTTQVVNTQSLPIGRAIEVPGLEHGRLTERTSIRRIENEIMLDIRFNVMLAATSMITMSGFRGSLTPSGPLPLTGLHGSKFTGSFDQSNGLIYLNVKADTDRIPAKTNIDIKFVLLNPQSQQSPPVFQIKAILIPPAKLRANRQVCAEKIIMYFGQTRQTALIPVSDTKLFEASTALSFSTKIIRESTKVNWGINTISIELIAPAPLPIDTVITLTGLATPIPSKVRFPLQGPSKYDFYFADTTCPMINGVQSQCFSTAVWSSGPRELTIKLVNELPLGHAIKLSFKFRNVGCVGGCPGENIIISALGPSTASFLVFESQPMDGLVMGAGVQDLAWIKKSVTQDHLVRSAPNKIRFSFRPNTPLYEGSQIVIQGIVGSLTTTCKQCRPPSILSGLGCDMDCAICAPEAIEGSTTTFRPCIAVYSPSTFPLAKHPKFVINSVWYSEQGRLVLTVEAGYVIPEDEDTDFVIIVQNNVIAGSSRADCTPSHTAEDLNFPSACMTIEIGSPQLCDPNANFGTECVKPEGATVGDPRTVGISSQAVDSFGVRLVDENPVIVRDADLHKLQRDLTLIPELYLDDVCINMPSLDGVPTLKDGVVGAGYYSIYVRLTNWVGKSARTDFEFEKVHPPQGQGKGVLANEFPKPRLMIEGNSHRTITNNVALSLSAAGRPIDCYPLQSDSLSYQWKMNCDDGDFGYCTLPPGNEINNIVDSPLVSDLQLPANSTVPGATYTFTCDVYQYFIPSQAFVIINVAVRGLIVKIEGASRGGFVRANQPLHFTGKNSYDPEAFMTGLTSSDFHWNWGCKELRALCTLPAELCPPNEFVECNPYWMIRRSTEQIEAAGIEGIPHTHTITTNETNFKPGWIYQVSVNVTRNAQTLIDLNRAVEDQIFASLPVLDLGTEDGEEVVVVTRTHDDLIVDTRWLKKTTSILEFNTIPAGNSPVIVDVTLCDPDQLGTDALCTSTLVGMVDPGSKVVLQAVGVSTRGGVITKYRWEVDGQQPLLDDFLLTSKTRNLLILKPNVLAPGLRLRFSVHMEDSQGESGTASIEVQVNHPPSGGRLTVSPDSGTALHTLFSVDAEQWSPSHEDNLPLLFDFFAVLSDAEKTLMSLKAGEIGNIDQTFLPAGDAASDYVLKVGVTVSDLLGTSVQAMEDVTVLLPGTQGAVGSDLQLAVEQSMNQIDEMITEKNLMSAQGLVGAVAQTLNQGEDVCAGNTVAACPEGTCCDRKLQKFKLFLKLQTADQDMAKGASKVKNEVNILKAITAKPQELSYESVRAMSVFVQNKLDELVLPDIASTFKDPEVLAGAFGTVVENLMSAAKVLVPNEIQVPYTLMATHRDENARPINTKSSSMRPGSLARSLKGSITLSEARGVFKDLIGTISGLSSLSVQQAVVGQSPVIIQRPGFVVNTSILDRNSFTSEYAAETDVGISILLPTNLFNSGNLVQMGQVLTDSIEVMHAVFYEAYNPLPGGNGPILVLEPRQRGQARSIDFLKLAKPVKLTLPFTNLSHHLVPPSDGFSITPYGKYFDFDEWKWSADGLSRTKLLDSSVEMETTHLSVFTCSEVWAGCDNMPLSGKFFDDCSVCGGTNSTCSGCDGFPNTGRDKGCSAHGECEYYYDNFPAQGIYNVFVPEKSKCSCEKDFYGDMCAIRCLGSVKCSGHGLCEPVKGEICLCNRGWKSTDAASGVFCDKSDGGASSGSGGEDPNEGKLNPSLVRSMLLYGIPAFVGLIVVCVVLYYLITYKRRQRESIRKTVIEFPQPQLEIPAEARPDASVMVPDDSGWTNFELPATTASFTYGPNSGQLASAIAASTRASVGQMSMQRIDRRANAMKKQLKKRSTVNKYKIEGPIHWEGDYDEEEDDEDRDSDTEDPSEGFSWFITQPPEWLTNPTQMIGDASYTDGTPSPDDDETMV